MVLPSADSISELPNIFKQFISKLDSNCCTYIILTGRPRLLLAIHFVITYLDTFRQATEDEVSTIISRTLKKSCASDSVQVGIWLKILSTLIYQPCITKLISNIS